MPSLYETLSRGIGAEPLEGLWLVNNCVSPLIEDTRADAQITGRSFPLAGMKRPDQKA